MLNEFKEFIAKGNVLDLAVGVIIGAAFTKIVDSAVADIITPPIGMVQQKDFGSLFVTLNGQSYPSLAAAKAAGAPTINYGVFLNQVINFLIVAFFLFLIVKAANRFKKKAEETTPGPTKDQELLTEIRDLLKAQRSS